MQKRFAAIAALALALFASAAAGMPEQAPVNTAAIQTLRPPTLLSDYRFFRDAGAREPNAGVTPYGLNTPLYSDGALKFRYVYIPAGTQAEYDSEGVFSFPDGAVLIKTFAFAADMRAPDRDVRFLETRLLVRQAGEWEARVYVWNASQTEARLINSGPDIPTNFIDTSGQFVTLDWDVPNTNQCWGCHEADGALSPIGPAARNMNGEFAFPEGPENQLAHWTRVGLLSGAPAPNEAPRVPEAFNPTSGTLNARARAYLDVNCAHCHNPAGPAHTSGLDLRWSQQSPVTWGVYKRPVAAGRGSAGYEFAIEPGHPERSYLLARMESTDPGVMMPELGRQLVDERAVALMREWIADMDRDGRPRQ